MTNRKNLITLLLILTVLQDTFAHTKRDYSFFSLALHAACSKLFGDKKASQEIQDYFNQAHHSFYPLEKSQQVPVKVINKCPFLNSFSSLTWYGNWINETDWNTAKDYEKTWYAYHEKAHEKLNHPTKQIALACITPFVFGPKKLSSYVVTAILTTLYARFCEKSADCAAAKKLCKQGKQEIVEKRIQDLALEKDSFSLLFTKPTTQIGYLKKIMQDYSKSS